MFDIVTIGSATRDIFIKDEHFQEIQENDLKVPRDMSPTDLYGVLPLGLKIEIQDVYIDSGGGATNAAVTFARQGFAVGCVSSIGQDCEGKEIQDGLAYEGIKAFFQTSPQRTGFSIILIAKGGERSILNFRGAGHDIKNEDIPWAELKAEWFYLSSLSGKQDGLERIFSFAKEQNISIVFNPGSQELALGLSGLRKFFEQMKALVINDEEARRLTGFKGDQDIFRALREINYNLIVVITKGQRGVSVSDGNTLWQAGIFSEKERVDRTGAGDAFGSGFLTGLIRSGIEEGIRIGSANGTSVVEYMGAKKGILRKDELNDPRWQALEIKKTLLD